MSGKISTEQPFWLRPGGDSQPLNNSTSSMESGYMNHSVPAGTSPGIIDLRENSDTAGRYKMIHWSLKIVTMLLCTLMIATALIGFRK